MQNAIFKALAHPLRRDILAALRKDPQIAGDLAGMFDVSWPTVSRHLSVLKEADLVFTERKGNQVLYWLNTSIVQDAAMLLLGLAGAGSSLPLDVDNGDNTPTQSETEIGEVNPARDYS